MSANINPRDGRAYPGEAYGFEKFTLASTNPEFVGLGNGVPDMLTTDCVATPECPFTIVEWRRRDAILRELALSQTEYVDPATRLEEGHLIDPEILLRGRIEDRPGTPKRLALIAWLVDAKTGARLSEDVSSVTLPEAFFISVERLGKLIMRDLICARAKVTPPAPRRRRRPRPRRRRPRRPSRRPRPTSIPGPSRARPPPSCRASGRPGAGPCAWTPRRTPRRSCPPPNGAPPGSYRTFTATTGSIDVTIAARPPTGCALDGSGHLELTPGFTNQVVVQLDVPNPYYVVGSRASATSSSRSRGRAGRSARARRCSRSSRLGRAPESSPTRQPRSRSTARSRC